MSRELLGYLSRGARELFLTGRSKSQGSHFEEGPLNLARRSGGRAVSCHSGVWGEAPAEIELGAF